VSHQDGGRPRLPDTPLRAGRGAVSLGAAVARFLDRYRDEKGTRATYAETLAHLLAAAGDTALVTELGPRAYAVVMSRWDDRAPATWNKHLAALRSFAAYAIRQEWVTADPARHLERRKVTQRGDKAIPLARLEALFTDDQHALRERVLWRLLYDTAARAEEILTLDIGDLDTEFRRARARSKGGDTEYLHWATATARLLPRLLASRTAGPVFLAGRRSPASGKRARALADIDPVSGRGRLSYPRAEYLFKQASALHDPTAPAGPCTSCGTARSGTWPPAAGPPPSSRPRAATSTSPPSGTTSGSARRPPPGSPRTTTRSPAATPADPVAADQLRFSVIVQPRLRPILVSCRRRPAMRSRASGPAIPIVMRSSVAW
jgi:hypothetical protein